MPTRLLIIGPARWRAAAEALGRVPLVTCSKHAARPAAGALARPRRPDATLESGGSLDHAVQSLSAGRTRHTLPSPVRIIGAAFRDGALTGAAARRRAHAFDLAWPN